MGLTPGFSNLAGGQAQLERIVKEVDTNGDGQELMAHAIKHRPRAMDAPKAFEMNKHESAKLFECL